MPSDLFGIAQQDPAAGNILPLALVDEDQDRSRGLAGDPGDHLGYLPTHLGLLFGLQPAGQPDINVGHDYLLKKLSGSSGRDESLIQYSRKNGKFEEK
jgi:hypothetical protein